HTGGLVHLEAPDAAVDLHTPQDDLRRWGGGVLRRGGGGVRGRGRGRGRRAARGLDGASVAGYRVCVRPMPADGRSIVGWLPGADGMYVAVTHSGVTLAAHLAELITAELVSGAAAAEVAPYRPRRSPAAAPAPDGP